jgi:hypothetical protein
VKLRSISRDGKYREIPPVNTAPGNTMPTLISLCGFQSWNSFPGIKWKVTDEKRLSKLEDVAGYVPRSFAPYFRDILDQNGKVFIEVTGSPVSSNPPLPAPHNEG